MSVCQPSPTALVCVHGAIIIQDRLGGKRESPQDGGGQTLG
jgi:hypothetical protein